MLPTFQCSHAVLFVCRGENSFAVIAMNVGAAPEEDRSVVPLRSTQAFGRAEPTLTDGEAVGEDGAPGGGCLVLQKILWPGGQIQGSLHFGRDDS